MVNSSSGFKEFLLVFKNDSFTQRDFWFTAFGSAIATFLIKIISLIGWRL